MGHIDAVCFRKINWLAVFERVESCIATIVYKYGNGIIPSNINGVFKLSYNRYNTRLQMALNIIL